MATARDLLVYLSVKNNGNWDLILSDIERKTIVSDKEIKQVLSTIKTDYVTIIDKEYPQELKKLNKPPFVVFGGK